MSIKIIRQEKPVTLYGNIIEPFHGINEGYISSEAGKIVAKGVGAPPKSMSRGEVLKLPGYYICPGFIDTHVHGGKGADFIDGTEEAFENITQFHANGGTTTLLATLIPTERKWLINCLQKLAAFIVQGGSRNGAKIVGIHLEGPFINSSKKGALDEKFLSNPDKDSFLELWEASKGTLRMITLSPELKGAENVIKEADGKGVVVSGGHTTANYPHIKEAKSWGLKNITHFYNAMKGFHHRDPGTIGAGLTLNGINLDLIPDENHVHPIAFQTALRAKGMKYLSIITDCTSPGGMKDGEYRLGGQKVLLQEGIARLDNGNLAGSTITMIEGVKYLVEKVGLSLQDAVGMACHNPARLMDLYSRKGELSIGKDADIIIFNDKFEVVMTMVEGKPVYRII